MPFRCAGVPPASAPTAAFGGCRIRARHPCGRVVSRFEIDTRGGTTGFQRATIPPSSPARTATIPVGATLVVARPCFPPVRGFGHPQRAPLQATVAFAPTGHAGFGHPQGAPLQAPGEIVLDNGTGFGHPQGVPLQATVAFAPTGHAGFGHPQGAPLRAGRCRLARPPLRGGLEASPSRCHCQHEPERTAIIFKPRHYPTQGCRAPSRRVASRAAEPAGRVPCPSSTSSP